MSATAALFPVGSGPLTVRDLEGMPDDGRRYELMDGTLVVSPAPGFRHQRIVYLLFGVLEAACPRGLSVVGAPFAVHFGDSVELQPDLLVGRRSDFTATDLPVSPRLVVEVLSPSTALIDLNAKRAMYARMGVPWYWVVDPNDLRFTVFELIDGVYRESAQIAADSEFVVAEPFPVRFVPSQLLSEPD